MSNEADPSVVLHTTNWTTFPLSCPADEIGLTTLMIGGSLFHYLSNSAKFELVVHSFLHSADARKTAEEIYDLYYHTGSRITYLMSLVNAQRGRISTAVPLSQGDLMDKLEFLRCFARGIDEGFVVHIGPHRIRMAGHKGAISNVFRIVVADDETFRLEVVQGMSIPKWMARENPVAKEPTPVEVKQQTEQLSKALYSQLISVAFFGDSLDRQTVDVGHSQMAVWMLSWPDQLKDILQTCGEAIKEMSATQRTAYITTHGHWTGSYCLDTLTDTISGWGPGPEPVNPNRDLKDLPHAVNVTESNIEEAREIRKLLGMINSVAVFSSNQEEWAKQMGLTEHLDTLAARTVDLLVGWVKYFMPIALKSLFGKTWLVDTRKSKEFLDSLDALYAACSDMLSEVHRVTFVELSMRVVIGHYFIALATHAQKSTQLGPRVQADLEAIIKLPAVVHLSKSERPSVGGTAVIDQCKRAVSSFQTLLEADAASPATNALQQLLGFIQGVAEPNSPTLQKLGALRERRMPSVPWERLQIKDSIPRSMWRFSCKIISFTPAAPVVVENETAPRSVLAPKEKYSCHLTVTKTTSSQSEDKVTAAKAPIDNRIVWEDRESKDGWMEFKGNFQSAEFTLVEQKVVGDRVLACESLEKTKVRYHAVLSACLTSSVHYSGAKNLPLTLELKKDGAVIGKLEIEVQFHEAIDLEVQTEKKKPFALRILDGMTHKFTTTKSIEPSWQFNRDIPASDLTDFLFPLSYIVKRWQLAAAKYLRDELPESDREKVNGTMAALTALKDLYMMPDPNWMLVRNRVWVGLVKATQDCGNSSVSMGFAKRYFELYPNRNCVGFINGGTGGVKMQMYGNKDGRVFTILEGKPRVAKFSRIAVRNYRPENYGMFAYGPAGKLSAIDAMKLMLKQTLDNAPWKNPNVLAHLGLSSSAPGQNQVQIFAFLTGKIREHWESLEPAKQAEMDEDVAEIFAFAGQDILPATSLLPGKSKKSFFIPQEQEGQRELVAVRAMYGAVAAQRVELKGVEVVSCLGIGTGSSQWCSIDAQNSDPAAYATTSIHCGMQDWDLVQRLGSDLVKDLQEDQGKLDAYVRKLCSYDRPTIALKSGASLGMWSSTFPNLRKELCALPSAHEGFTYGVPEICANMTSGQKSVHQYLGMHMRDGIAEFRTTEKPPAWLMLPSSKEDWGSVSPQMLDSIQPAMEFCYQNAIKQHWADERHLGIDSFLRNFKRMSEKETEPVVLKKMFSEFDASLCKYVSWLDQFRKDDVKRCFIANTCSEGHTKITGRLEFVLSRLHKGTENAEEKECKASDLPSDAAKAFSSLCTLCVDELVQKLVACVLAVFRGEDKRALREIVNCCGVLEVIPKGALLSELRPKLANLEPEVRALRLERARFPEEVEAVKNIMKPLFDTRARSQRDWVDSFQPLEALAQTLEKEPLEATPSTSSKVAAFLHKSST